MVWARNILIANLVSISNQDEFHAERSGSSVVTGHSQEDSVSQFDVRARRQADGWITIAKRGLQRGAEFGGMEQAANVGFSEMEVWHEMERRED